MGTHPIFESDFDCLTDVVLMPSYLGEFARATLKAAVINAENRNRLNEEDKCWREKSDKREKRSHTSKNANKYENNRPLVTVDRIKSKRNIDKWVLFQRISLYFN